MATKSKLEQAVEKQAETLNEAQRRIVSDQLSIYKKNKDRITWIEARLKAVNARPAASLEEVRSKQAERSTLTYEHTQLSIANSKIASELFGFMKEQ